VKLKIKKKDAEKKLKRMKKKDGEENNNAELQKIIEESERKLREEKEKNH